MGLYGIIHIEVFLNYFTMRGISMIQRKRLAAALLSLTMALASVYPAVPSFAAAWERNANGSYVAVSYTHLDVYKRQMYMRIPSAPAMARSTM